MSKTTDSIKLDFVVNWLAGFLNIGAILTIIGGLLALLKWFGSSSPTMMTISEFIATTVAGVVMVVIGFIADAYSTNQN